MKVLLLALVLTLMFTNGSCLTCYNCVPSRPGGKCVTTKRTCGRKHNACVTAISTKPLHHFRRCISMADCLILQANPYIVANCCQKDLCNTPVS